LANHGVKMVPLRLRAAMHRIVLGRRRDLQVCGITSLEPFHHGHANPAGQEWVFSIGLLSTSPAGIAEDVDVRRPEGESLVDTPIALADGLVMLGSRLGGGHLGHLLDEWYVPRGCHANGLRKDGCDPGARHAVQAFVPPVVGGDPQALDGGRVMHHL